jgi:hypothetical protein
VGVDTAGKWLGGHDWVHPGRVTPRFLVDRCRSWPAGQDHFLAHSANSAEAVKCQHEVPAQQRLTTQLGAETYFWAEVPAGVAVGRLLKKKAGPRFRIVLNVRIVLPGFCLVFDDARSGLPELCRAGVSLRMWIARRTRPPHR